MPKQDATAEQIRDAVLSIVTNHPAYTADAPDWQIGYPVPLQQPDDDGCDWTMHLPGTAHTNPDVEAALVQVGRQMKLIC